MTPFKRTQTISFHNLLLLSLSLSLFFFFFFVCVGVCSICCCVSVEARELASCAAVNRTKYIYLQISFVKVRVSEFV